MPSVMPGEDDRVPPIQMDQMRDLEKSLDDMGVSVTPRCLSRGSGGSENALRALVDYLAEKIHCMEKEQRQWQHVIEARLKNVEKQSTRKNPLTSDQPEPCDEAQWPGPGGPKWEARLEDVKVLADAQPGFQHSASPPVSGESTKDRLYWRPSAIPCVGEPKSAAKAAENNLLASGSRCEQPMSRAPEELEANREVGAFIADSTKQFERMQADLYCLRQDFVSLWMSHNSAREIRLFDGSWMDEKTKEKVGEVRSGVMNWVESYKRDASILMYSKEGDEVLQLDIDAVTHEGRVAFCEYSGKRHIEWDSGDTWLHAIETDIKSRAKERSRQVFRLIFGSVLPFQEQLNMFDSRRAHRIRSCASWSLLGFFLWYFVFCMYRIAHPVDYYDLNRDLQYWASGEESLPLVAFDTGRLPAGYVLKVTHTDMDNKGHQIENQVHLQKCTVQQRSRTTDALCMPGGTKVVGTYGDPSYKYVKVKVLVPKAEFYTKSWNSMSMLHRFHNNQYARFIESLYFTYPNRMNETSVHELSFEKIDCRNGTAVGMVESLGFSSMLETERLLNLKGVNTRIETLDESGDHVVAMKLYLRAALTEVMEVYEPYSIIDFFEKAGSLFASFGFFLTLLVAIGIVVPRIMGRLWHHTKRQDIVQANSESSERH